MGKSKKSTKKFVRKQLSSQVKVRKQHQRIAKLKKQSENKFKKSVQRHVAKKEEEDQQLLAEANKKAEVDSFVSKKDENENFDEGLEQGIISDADASDSEAEEEAVSGESDDDQADGASEVASELDEDEIVGASGGQDANDDSDDDNESGSGDEDPVKADNKKLKSEIAKHKAQLEALKKQDPEFYKYLEQADERLLEFGMGEEDDDDDDDDELDDDNDEDVENRQEGGVSAKQKSGTKELTLERVEELCKNVKENRDRKSFELLLGAYKVACAYGEDADNDAEKQTAIQFSSSAAYTKVMLFVLREADGLFRTFLGLENKSRISPMDIKKAAKKYRSVHRKVLAFFLHSIPLLSQVLEDRMLAFVLRRLRCSIVLMGDQPKLARKILKPIFTIFSEGEGAARLQAILFVRELAINQGQATMDVCMKGVYRTFLTKAHQMNKKSAVHLHFMATCVIEIYGLNAQSAYQHAFSFIRQLAVQLREALVMKKKDSVNKVFSWRYINCLELWARLVSTHIEKGDMRHLVYPIAQLLSGVIKFRQQPKFLPLRLRVIRTLNSLSAATGFYIPVSSFLLGILHWPLLAAKPVLIPGDKCPDLSCVLKVPDKVLKGNAFQAEVVDQVYELLASHLAQWSYSIAFPELSFWICFHLRKFVRTGWTEKWKRSGKQLIVAIEQSAQSIQQRRDVVDFSPKDLQKVEAFAEEGKRNGKSAVDSLALILKARFQQRASMQTTDMMVIGEKDGQPSEPESDSESEAALEDEEGDEMEGLDELPGDDDLNFGMEDSRGEMNGDQRKEVELNVDLDIDMDDPDKVEEYVPSDDDQDGNDSNVDGTEKGIGKSKKQKQVKGKEGKEVKKGKGKKIKKKGKKGKESG